MTVFYNFAVSCGFLATLTQITFWILRNETTLEPRISWLGACGVSACVLLLLACFKVVLTTRPNDR